MTSYACGDYPTKLINIKYGRVWEFPYCPVHMDWSQITPHTVLAFRPSLLPSISTAAGQRPGDLSLSPNHARKDKN